MKKYALLCLLFLGCMATTGYSQIGILASYNHQSLGKLNDYFNGQNALGKPILTNGYKAGVNYWYRLPYHRVEFWPTLFYSSHSGSIETPFLYINKASIQKFGLEVDTRVYVLEFNGDCHCPTFSKQNKFIDKGFYLDLLAGGSYGIYKADGISENHPGWHLGLGAGLDIGLSDFLTLTPFIQGIYASGSRWDALGISGSELSPPKASGIQLNAGVHFALRWKKYDY